MPNLQRGGHASILLTFLCNFAILMTQKRGPWHNGSPLNTLLPVRSLVTMTTQFSDYVIFSDYARTQGLAEGFRSLMVAIFHDLVQTTFVNLWQSCHSPALHSISFSVFLLLSHQLLSVVPLLDPFLHLFSPHAPTIALSETLPFSLHPSSHDSSHCLFHLSRFSTYHSQHSYQRWSPRGRPWPRGRPRGHILKSLALKPQVLGLGLEALGPRKLPCPVADLGGDGWDASPPTSLKVTILAEKSALFLNNLAPFRDAYPPPT